MFLARWAHNLRTALELASRLESLEDEWDEVRQDWLDKRDSLDRLLRRLTLRATRTGAREAPAQDDVGATIVRPEGDGGGSPEHAELWARARAKGALR